MAQRRLSNSGTLSPAKFTMPEIPHMTVCFQKSGAVVAERAPSTPRITLLDG